MLLLRVLKFILIVVVFESLFSFRFFYFILSMCVVKKVRLRLCGGFFYKNI